MNVGFPLKFCGLWRDFSKVSGKIISEYILREIKGEQSFGKRRSALVSRVFLSTFAVWALTLNCSVSIHLFVRPSNLQSTIPHWFSTLHDKGSVGSEERGRSVTRFLPNGQPYRRSLDQNIGQKNRKRWQSPMLTEASEDFTVDLRGAGVFQRGIWGILVMQDWTYR